jgi:hypothetical protein
MCRNTSSQLERLTATTECPALVAAHGALITKLEEADAHAAIQSLPIQGRTKDRNEVFAKTWNAAFVVAGLVRSYASANRLHDLAAKVRVKRYSFDRGRIRRRIELAQQIHDAAAGVLPQLAGYRVTAETLADLQTKIDAADALFTAIRSAIANRKLATGSLEEALRQAHDLLRDEIDPLVESLRDENPAAYALYRTARMIIHLPGTPAEPPAAASEPSPQAPAVPALAA